MAWSPGVGSVTHTLRDGRVCGSTAGEEIKYLARKELSGFIQANKLKFFSLIVVFISIVLTMPESYFRPGREVPTVFPGLPLPPKVRVIFPGPVEDFLELRIGSASEKAVIFVDLDEPTSLHHEAVSLPSPGGPSIKNLVLPCLAKLCLWSIVGIPGKLCQFGLVAITGNVPSAGFSFIFGNPISGPNSWRSTV